MRDLGRQAAGMVIRILSLHAHGRERWSQELQLFGAHAEVLRVASLLWFTKRVVGS